MQGVAVEYYQYFYHEWPTRLLHTDDATRAGHVLNYDRLPERETDAPDEFACRRVGRASRWTDDREHDRP